MKREIKFRAWDKEKNEMYKPTYEAYNGKLFELMVGFSGDLLAHTITGVEHESIFPNRFELMQYTGLKDKNGKEIYEGDVVVVYSEGEEVIEAFRYVAEIPDVYNRIGSEDRREIIGNIYENPNLLK